MPRSRFRRFAAALLLLCAPAARAQNLLPNSTFSSLFMLQGWPDTTNTTWSSTDVDQLPNSGSARVTIDTKNSFVGIRSVCVPIQGGINYRASASALWLDAESSADGQFYVSIFFHPVAQDCSTIVGYVTGTLQSIPANAWHSVDTSFTAPDGDQAAEVLLQVEKTSASAGTFVGYFDDAELTALPEPDVADAGLCAVLAVAAIASRGAARRRVGGFAGRYSGG